MFKLCPKEKRLVNIILLDSEISNIKLTDHRAEHIIKVLRAEVGQTIRVGKINGPKGLATVLMIDHEQVSLSIEWENILPERPRVDLALALPRPQAMKRLWPQLAALGVGHIALINANRVERYYFDSHVIRKKLWNEPLVEGLQQGVDTRLPEVSIHKQFKVFVNQEVNEHFPNHQRVLLDPSGDRALFDMEKPAPEQRVLLTIGPEGGWVPFEIEMMHSTGFESFTLGRYVLRVEQAVTGALSQLELALHEQ